MIFGQRKKKEKKTEVEMRCVFLSGLFTARIFTFLLFLVFILAHA